MTPRKSLVFSELSALLSHRIGIFDGGMGTMAQKLGLDEEGFRGEEFKNWPKSLLGNNDFLNLSQPSKIQDIHLQYAMAGADILLTNTVCSVSVCQSRYGASHLVRRMNIAGAEVCRKAALEASSATGRRIFVAGSVGPANCLATYNPLVEDDGEGEPTLLFSELVVAYSEQVRALLDGDVDLLAIETIVDTLNAKAALFAVHELFEKEGYTEVPVLLSATVSKEGNTLTQQTIEAFAASCSHAEYFSIGLNCSYGSETLKPFMKILSSLSTGFAHCYPNAGLPDASGNYSTSAVDFAASMKSIAESCSVHWVGGCCGTTPEHIQLLAAAVKDLPATSSHKSFDNGSVVLSGTRALCLLPCSEGCSISSSDRLREALQKEALDDCVRVAREDIQRGSAVLSVALLESTSSQHSAAVIQHASRVMSRAVSHLCADPVVAEAALLLISSERKALEAGLQSTQGRPLVQLLYDMSKKDVKEVIEDMALLHHLGGCLLLLCRSATPGSEKTWCDESLQALRHFRIPRSSVVWDITEATALMRNVLMETLPHTAIVKDGSLLRSLTSYGANPKGCDVVL